jgi:salicylate hydroxylase
MLPTQGQGASQAIEDSEALGAFFEDVTAKPSIEEITAIFTVCFIQ